MAEEVEAAVIGAGQAGLAISYYLTQQCRTHVVLEQAGQIAPAWRDGRWDSFTLVIGSTVSTRMVLMPRSSAKKTFLAKAAT